MNLKAPLAKKAQVKVPAAAENYWGKLLQHQHQILFSPEQREILRRQAEERERARIEAEARQEAT